MGEALAVLFVAFRLFGFTTAAFFFGAVFAGDDSAEAVALNADLADAAFLSVFLERVDFRDVTIAQNEVKDGKCMVLLIVPWRGAIRS